MSDQEGQDHWGLLASNLGIDPREEAGDHPSQEAAAAEEPLSESEVGGLSREESASGVEAKAYVKKSARVSRTAEDWARLASGLGVELPPEESVCPGVSEMPTVPAEPSAEPVVEKAAEQPSGEPEAVAEQWTESVIELMEESLESAEPGIQESIAPQPADDRRPERRRRRRRRRSRRPAEDEIAGAGTGETHEAGGLEQGEAVSEGESASAEQHFDEDGFPGETAPAEVPAGDEPQPARPKRRRRRRGGDRRRDRERVGQEGGATAKAGSVVSRGGMAPEVSAEKPPIADERTAEHVTPAEPDDELGEEFDEDRTDKDGHRAIPSWQEAVGHMVDRNMEARARKPDSGSSRTRGSRGRGRGRD